MSVDINLDLSKETYPIVKCKQNDDLTLCINLYNNGSKHDIEEYTAILNVLRSNNTFVKQTGNIIISKNAMLISCMRDITRIAGLTKMELVMTSKSGKQRTTFNIKLNVIPSVITDNAEASKNVIGVIEDLDNKIMQGTVIVKEVDTKKSEVINTLNEFKTNTITEFNDTKKELNKTTIAELNDVEKKLVGELNSAKDTLKKDITQDINKEKNEAIECLNKYNVKEVNDKVDSISNNLTSIWGKMKCFLSDEYSTDIKRLSVGFLSRFEIGGLTILKDGKLESFGEAEGNKIILQTKININGDVDIDRLEIQLEEPLRSIRYGGNDYISGDGILHIECGVRKYQNGDENNKEVITDKANTVYTLDKPIKKPLNKLLFLNAISGCKLYCENKMEPDDISAWYSTSFYHGVFTIGDSVAKLRDLIVKQDEEIQLLKQQIK